MALIDVIGERITLDGRTVVFAIGAAGIAAGETDCGVGGRTLCEGSVA
jgi:hypothetical protein